MEEQEKSKQKEEKVYYYTAELYCKSGGKPTSLSHWPKVVGDSQNEDTLKRIPVYCYRTGENGPLREYFTKKIVSSQVCGGLSFVTAKPISKKEFAKGAENLTLQDIRRIKERVEAFEAVRIADFEASTPEKSKDSNSKGHGSK